MAIYDVITAAQTLVKAGVSKIGSAPVYPTFSVPADVLVCEAMPTNVRISSQSSGMKLTLFDLRMELVRPLASNREAIGYLLSTLPEAVAEIFLDNPTISGTCSTWEGEITAQPATAEIAGITVIGWIITVPNVKINGTH